MPSWVKLGWYARRDLMALKAGKVLLEVSVLSKVTKSRLEKRYFDFQLHILLILPILAWICA